MRTPNIKILSYFVEALSKVSIKSLLNSEFDIDGGLYNPVISHFLLLTNTGLHKLILLS